MSVNINLDRSKLLEALLRQHNMAQILRFSFGEADRSDLYYKDGWFFVSLKQGGYFPALAMGRVHADSIPANGVEGSATLVYFHEVKPMFLQFFEVDKAMYNTYIGIDLEANGSITYVNNVENQTETIMPAGTVKPGDVWWIGTYFKMEGTTKKFQVLLRKVDFTTRSYVEVLDYQRNIGYNLHVVTAYALEPKGVAVKFGVALAVAGPYQFYFDIVPWLLKYGLPDPRDVHPWK